MIVSMNAFRKMLQELKEKIDGNADLYSGSQMRFFFRTYLVFQKILENNIGRPKISLDNDEKKLFQKIKDLKPAKQASTPKRASKEIRLLREELAELKKRPNPHRFLNLIGYR